MPSHLLVRGLSLTAARASRYPNRIGKVEIDATTDTVTRVHDKLSHEHCERFG